MANRHLDELLFPKRKYTIRMNFRVPFLNRDRRRERVVPQAAAWLWNTGDDILWDTGNTVDY